MVVIRFKKLSKDAYKPIQAHPGDAGYDIRASADTFIPPGAVSLVPTGLSVAVPLGYELQVRGKSGMALKEGLTVAQGVGTIDSGYRGEVCVLIKNANNFGKMIRKSEMIAQLILNEIPASEWKEVSTLDDTERGTDGFGSTKETEKLNNEPAEIKTVKKEKKLGV